MVFVSGKEVRARVRNKYEESQLDAKLFQIRRKANHMRELYAQQTQELLQRNRDYLKSSGWSPHAIKPRRAELRNGLLHDLSTRLTPWDFSVRVKSDSSPATTSTPTTRQSPCGRPHTSLDLNHDSQSKNQNGPDSSPTQRILRRRAKSAHATLASSKTATNLTQRTFHQTMKDGGSVHCLTDIVDGFERNLSLNKNVSDNNINAAVTRFGKYPSSGTQRSGIHRVCPSALEEHAYLQNTINGTKRPMKNGFNSSLGVHFINTNANDYISESSDSEHESDVDTSHKIPKRVTKSIRSESIADSHVIGAILPKSASIKRRTVEEFLGQTPTPSPREKSRKISVDKMVAKSNVSPCPASPRAESRKRCIRHFNATTYIPPQERYKDGNLLLMKKKMLRTNVTQLAPPSGRVNMAFSKGARRQALLEMMEENKEKIENERKREPVKDNLQDRVNTFIQSVSQYCPSETESSSNQ